MNRNFKKEFSPQTPSEKALVNLLSLSYERIKNISNQLERASLKLFEPGFKALSPKEKQALRKELDRSHRQFNSSLALLKQIKTPSMQIEVKSHINVQI